jgi:hypothetical protein
MFELLSLAVTVGAGVLGYVTTKDFTKRKLRFVDAVHSRPAPIIAGVVVAVIASPLAALPIITGVTALALGAGVGLGVRSAQKERHLLE